MKTILKIAAGVTLAIVVLGAGCAALLSNAADDVDADIEAEREAERLDLASTVGCGADDIGYAAASGQVTNGSSKPSTYVITVTFTGSDGVQYADGIASVLDLAPGATAEWEASAFEEWREGTSCDVSDVERLAS